MLNLYHPLRAFEEICMLDHLSDDDRFRFFHPDRDRLRGWGGRIRTSDTLATAFAPCATSLSAFVRVRLYTLTSWPAFRRLDSCLCCNHWAQPKSIMSPRIGFDYARSSQRCRSLIPRRCKHVSPHPARPGHDPEPETQTSDQGPGRNHA